jgi:exopolysaccharide biosynthesis polyprenyl glycosylphosphotransferase
MLRQRNIIRSSILYLGDLMATGLAFLCAYYFRDAFPAESYASLFPLSWYLHLLWLIFPIWSLVFYLGEHYSYWRGPGFGREAWWTLQSIFFSALILGFFVFALKYQFVSRIFIVCFAFFDWVLIVLFRWLVRQANHFFSQYGESYRFILMVGTDDQALKLAQEIENHRDLGFRILGFLYTQDPNPPERLNGYPILGHAQNLLLLLEREVIDEVIFAVSSEELRNMDHLLLACEERGITARVILNFFPHAISRTHLEELDGFPLLTFSTTPKNELILFLRRILDFSASLFILFLLSPFILVLTVLIRMDTPGPALYRQVRCGLNGRKFTCYKFRSMYTWAEEKKQEILHLNLMSGPVFKAKNDPRITRVGRFLRRTSLDELPQLFNVLKGDMSFVGPRPPLPAEVVKYKGWERRRLSMKPGITGLWQVSGRNQVDFSEWVRMDLEYIDNWSLWLDFKILLKTIPAVLSGKGAM